MSNNDKGIAWMYQHKQMESEKEREEYLLGNKRIQGAKFEDDYDKLRKSTAPGAKFLTSNTSLATLEAAAKKLDKNDPMYGVKLAQIKKQQEKVAKEQQEKKKRKRKEYSSSSSDDDEKREKKRHKKKRRSDDDSEDEKYRKHSHHKSRHDERHGKHHQNDKQQHHTSSSNKQLSEQEIQQRLQEMEQLGKARLEAKADAMRKHDDDTSKNTNTADAKSTKQQLGPSFLNKLAKDAYLGDNNDSLEQQLKRKKFTLQKSSNNKD